MKYHLQIDRSLNFGRHLVQKFLSRSDTFRSVLDLGAGRGDDLLIARKYNSQAVLHGVEIFPQAAKQLHELGIHVHRLDIEKDRLPFDDNSIDIVIANQILEHTKELFWILHEVSRVLSLGGKFIIGVPNLAALHNRILLAFGRQPSPLKNSSAHIRGYTKSDLILTLESCFPGGYRLCDFGGSNFYPFPPVLARPLAVMFPNMAWGIFFLFAKQHEYHEEFLSYPITQSLETNFFLGKQ